MLLLVIRTAGTALYMLTLESLQSVYGLQEAGLGSSCVSGSKSTEATNEVRFAASSYTPRLNEHLTLEMQEHFFLLPRTEH